MTEQERENTRLARELIHALARNDVEYFAQAFTDDAVTVCIGETMSRDITTGKKMIAANRGVGGATLKWEYNIYETTAQDDRVAIEVESLHRRPNGKLYNNRYHFLMKFREGKIYHYTEYTDTEMVTWGLYDGQRPWPMPTEEERTKAFYERRALFPQD